MIKSIILKNFQAHSYLKLDFSDNLNIITGLSDVGKSCIRRAIDWICFNANISESDYRKEGTDVTSVTLMLHNGFEIERVRSNSLKDIFCEKKDVKKKFLILLEKIFRKKLKMF
jgi:DNA repair ATPase RecN